MKLAFILEERETSKLRNLWILMCEDSVINQASLVDPGFNTESLTSQKTPQSQAKRDCETPPVEMSG